MRTIATSSRPSSLRAAIRSKNTLPLQNTTRAAPSPADVLVPFPVHRLELAGGEFLQRRHRLLVPQQALRREDDQRLAVGPDHLPAQQEEHLHRRRRHADLHVVVGAQLQEALDAAGGMLRALPFVAVRQHQHHAADAAPLHFAGGDELVDHHLRAVGEVAELRLPDHQLVRLGGGVAVLEAEHRFLRQHRVDDHEVALVGRDVLQRNEGAGVRTSRGSGRAARRGGGRRCRGRCPGPKCAPSSRP